MTQIKFQIDSRWNNITNYFKLPCEVTTIESGSTMCLFSFSTVDVKHYWHTEVCFEFILQCYTVLLWKIYIYKIYIYDNIYKIWDIRYKIDIRYIYRYIRYKIYMRYIYKISQNQNTRFNKDGIYNKKIRLYVYLKEFLVQFIINVKLLTFSSLS